MLEGLIQKQRGRLRQAIELFGTGTDHPATRGTAFTHAGESFYRMRRFDDARRALEQAVLIDPKNVDAHRWLASTYYDLGLMTAALSTLRTLADLAPDDARPHRLAGLILKDFEKYDEAVTAYRESLRRDPQQPNADQVRVELVESLIRLRRYDEAFDELKPARSTADVLRLQAEIAHARSDSELAFERLNRSLQLAPNDPQVLSLLGRIKLETGDAEEAVEVLRRAVAIDPAGYEIRTSLAQALRQIGRTAEADEQTQRMLELRDLRSRFTSLHEQAMTSPGDAGVRYELGRVALELNRSDLARGWFEAALAIDPTHAGAGITRCAHGRRTTLKRWSLSSGFGRFDQQMSLSRLSS